MALTLRDRTFVDALLRLEGCDACGARFVQRSGDAVFHPYGDVLARAKDTAGALQAWGLRPGDRVGIVLPTGIEFFDAFLGVELAGGVPAALYPPLRLGKLDEYFLRTRRMLQKIGARLLITEPRIRKILGPVVDKVDCIDDVLDAGSLGRVGRWTPVAIEPGSPAFLQFSSGTTLEPKAVCVSHVNLLSNLEMIDSLFQGLTPEEVAGGGVCWLPLYHDMGLLGCMCLGLYHPGTVTYIGPEHFIARPRIWLETLSRYRAAVSPAPDFAYGLCASKIRPEELADLDLSRWKIALNGAEVIDPEVMLEFCRRMAPSGFRPEAMTPAYGLAEAGLAVSVAQIDRPPIVREFDRQRLSEDRRAVPGRGRTLVSVGRPVPGMELEIRDAHGQRLEEGRVGTITVRGPSITPGYFNDVKLSAAIIRDGWLDTGDLGFVSGGELYITGRAKDLIIIRGRNYAPQEIERLLAGIQGVRPGCVMALGAVIEGHGEQLVVLAEHDAGATSRTPEEIRSEIAERVLAGISLTPYDVRLLARGTLPRTSSGKPRRAEALRQYLADALTAPRKVSSLLLAKELGRSQLAWSRRWLRRSVGRADAEGRDEADS
jgi:acyl-CoA synthetase (AMP-forming)/AMP-acid ligase II